MLLLCALILAYVSHALCNVGCGKQAAGNNPNLPSNWRIIGGSTAKRYSWPWIVSNQLNGNHFCGGTLLRVKDGVEASDIVMTAAHCVVPDKIDDPIDYKGWAVSANLHWRSYTTGAETRNVLEAVHAGYTPIRNDVAILKLDKPIKFTNNIRPVCLPKQGEALPTGKLCMTAGWGRTSSKDLYTLSDVLQQVKAPVHPGQYCLQRWTSTWFVETMMLCAGSKDGSSNICNGDSGGPLMCRADDGRWVQYGISSYVVKGPCVAVDYPGVFARVSNYVDWINAQIRNLTSL